ncbi:DEAD/DEAH box helicase [Pseudarthrobacter sp. R1]|uniref:DEAD/DEAH box helicase n=1 Tax=Pseudarthrobacter sp. R1 TaxID=2944934 RepID=UPI002109C1F5|nr:DEAD/DEAH box helicase [Pseudarthrobacter sp. R1]MCQ6269118.1 DEAD/DEAH box helicase [Pseudarthrobacter sp. R1]
MTVGELHPIVVHHIVNTLQWSGLRPLQESAVEPLMNGVDTLLLAPTAGGKTEAAAFPLLSRMATERWQGLSVIYVCPLKALLNNLLPRLEKYAAWTGNRCGIWHGDIGASAKKRMREDPPSILLTTPESLESLLVSTKTDPRAFFGEVRAVVVDEIHAFAGDDRGWHLLGVLERVSRLSRHTMQRIGLSATVGNPDEILGWFQGSYAGRPGVVVNPDAPGPAAAADVTLDFVGGANSTANAAKVIASLHGGEKRLVFCESRLEVEELAVRLRELGMTTFLSHSSLSVDERRQAEEAFAESRDCIIVSTSTLELGIDVGDLDRMIQIDSPRTVASFLQRLGRTGRRPGTSRNALFLTKTPSSLLQAAGLLHLWSEGFVEPVVSPPNPLHIDAQQLLALCLQEGRVGRNTWGEWFGNAVLTEAQRGQAEYMLAQGFLEEDQGMLFIGKSAEKRFGRRNFMDLLAVFTAPQEFKVLHGGREIGQIDANTFSTSSDDAPISFVLAGRRWKVTGIEWGKKRCHVEASDFAKKTRWLGSGGGIGYALAQSQRSVLLGDDPGGVRLSKRAVSALQEVRAELVNTVSPTSTVLVQDGEFGSEWWTWSGASSESVLASTLGGVIEPSQRFGSGGLRLAEGCGPGELRRVSASFLNSPDHQFILPYVSESAVAGLKFNELLPPAIASAVLAERCADVVGAQLTLERPVRTVDTTSG